MSNNKYNLSKLLVGQSKVFSIEIYSKIRLAAHFTAKRYGWKISTKKQPKTVKVTRLS